MADKDTNEVAAAKTGSASTKRTTADTPATVAEAPTPEPKPAVPTLTPEYTPHPRFDHRRARPLAAALIGIVVLALGFGGGWLGAVAQHDGPTDITQQKTVLTSQAAVVSSIAKTVGQSVVSVDVTSQSQASANPFDGFFGGTGGGSQTEQSAGTGMILTSSGLIMTNRHVVPSGTTQVSVTLSDGTVFDNVKVVGRTNDNSSLDVAFLQIQDTKGKTLTPVKLGDSSKVNVGDPVVAIGNALGQFQNTVTSGIISGHGRSVQASDSTGSSSENLSDLFQTDAAINEGNSGGPLVNLNGEVIGMNTAIASDSQNIGFAIPINDLTGLITSVEQSGTLQQPYLGVVYVPITSDIKEEFNLTVGQGAYIPKEIQIGEQTVLSGGPAAKAGVKEGDIITKIDGKAVNQTTSITSLIDQHKVGDKVTLTIVRGSKTLTLDVTLGSAPTS